MKRPHLLNSLQAVDRLTHDLQGRVQGYNLPDQVPGQCAVINYQNSCFTNDALLVYAECQPWALSLLSVLSCPVSSLL